MTQNDGSLLFDTSIDSTGFSGGISSLAGIAVAGLSAVAGAVAGASAYAINVGSAFEEGMSGVAAISGATGEELAKLESTAKELGATTKFSASEAATAMTNLAAAGFTTSEIISATPGLMNLAAASGEDLATSTDIAASTLRGFGLDASETAHVADVLAENANRTNAAVADTGEAMKYVAPVAKAMGISMEETSAAIGIMSNSGIKGSQAGTTLRGALTRLVKPTDDMTSTMEDLGLEFFDTEGNMKDLTSIVEELEKGTKGLTSQQKNQALTTLFGQEALSGMLSLVDGGAGQLEDLTQSYINCDGSASAMASTMNDNLNGKLTIMQSSLEGLGIAAYEKFEAPMKGAVDSAISEINGLTDQLGEGGNLEGAMTTAAGYVGDLVEGFASFAADAIPAVISGFNWFVENLDIIALGLGSVAAAYGVYTAAVSLHAFTQAHATGIATLSAAAELAHGTVVSFLAGELTLAAAAQELFTTAQMACPWGLIALGVAGVVAAFGGLILGTKALAGETGEMVDSVISNKDAWEELQEAQKTQIATDMGAIERTANLKDELDGLVDANGKVKKGYEERAKYIAKELSDATGTEIKLVDGVIQEYSKLSDEIDGAIAKQRLESVVSAMEASYKEATENKAAAYDNMQKLDELYESQETAMLKRYNDLKAKGYSEEQIQQDQTYKNLAGNLAGTKSLLDNASQTYNDYVHTIAYYEELQRANAEGNTEKINQLMEEHQQYMLEQGRKSGNSLRDQVQQAVDDYNILVEARRNGDKTVTDSMLKAAEEQYNTVVQSGINMLRAYQSDSEKYFGVGSDKIEEMLLGLQSQDPELHSQAQEMLLGLMNDLKSDPDANRQIGYDIIAGIGIGLESGIPLLREKAYKASSAVSEEFSSYYEIASPSRFMRRMGGYITQGLAIGLDKGAGEAITAMSGIDERLHDEIDTDYAWPVVESVQGLMGGIASHVNSSFGMNPSYGSTAGEDYTELGKAVAKAIIDSDIKIEVDRRPFGRLVSEVI